MIPHKCQEDIGEEFEVRCSPICVRDVLSIPNLVLYLSTNFLVIDKPPDLRMNGQFDATVEKVIQNLMETKLINEFKWIHQLDFATSGVLCIGLNNEAGRLGSLAFENRVVYKEYLAIVHGHIQIDRFPRLESHPKFPCAKVLYKPDLCEVAPLETWQGRYMLNSLEQFYNVFQHFLKTTELNIDQKNIAIMNELASCTYDNFIHNRKLRKTLRKFLKSVNIHIDVGESNSDVGNLAVEADLAMPTKMTHNNSEHPIHSTSTQFTYSTSIPPRIYRYAKDYSPVPAHMEDPQCRTQSQTYVYERNSTDNLVPHLDISSTTSTSTLPEDKIIINLPIAEIPENFKMKIGISEDEITGKDCETHVEILEYGYYNGYPVTKVLLHPITGRRHQLRLHCQAMGHPIGTMSTIRCMYVCISMLMPMYAPTSGGLHVRIQQRGVSRLQNDVTCLEN